MTKARINEIRERGIRPHNMIGRFYRPDTVELMAALRRERKRADRLENQLRELLDNLKATIGAAATRLTDSSPLPAEPEPEDG